MHDLKKKGSAREELELDSIKMTGGFFCSLPLPPQFFIPRIGKYV